MKRYNSLGASPTDVYEYHPTILNTKSLLERLAVELRFTFFRLEETWLELRRDPISFGRHSLRQLRDSLTEHLERQNIASGLTALNVVLITVLVVTQMEGLNVPKEDSNDGPEIEVAEILTLPDAAQSAGAASGPSLGTGSEGRVGFNIGRGEGSEQRQKRSGGGGSGGMKDDSDAQQGKLPQPSDIPAPISRFPPARRQVLDVAGIDLDPALWRNLSSPLYGNPLSNSMVPSNGPGDGGGMGTNRGTGIGDGDGDGIGKGSGGNMGDGSREIGGPTRGGASGSRLYDPDEVFSALRVTQRARVLAKPEPQYTDEARRNLVTGTVVLRVVFSRTGDVVNIRAIQTLPFGLTERAIAAARQIRFLPAMKDSRPVSVHMQLEYNFNLY